MGTFSHVKTGKVVNFVNTHLDHRSVKSREYSAKLIIQYIKSIPIISLHSYVEISIPLTLIRHMQLFLTIW